MQECSVTPVYRTMPASDSTRFDLSRWKPTRDAPWWMLGGLAVGLLLFAWAWQVDRERATAPGDTAPPVASAERPPPLPAPVAAGRDTASGMGAPRASFEDEADRPELVETAPPPPPQADLPDPVAESDGAPPAPPTPAADSEPRPLPGQTPAPSYPSSAFRRGETGVVLVRATIDSEGRPRDLEVARTSGSRRLDRAAVSGVRQWRFAPAMRDGQPVEATVNIPIEFRR